MSLPTVSRIPDLPVFFYSFDCNEPSTFMCVVTDECKYWLEPVRSPNNGFKRRNSIASKKLIVAHWNLIVEAWD